MSEKQKETILQEQVDEEQLECVVGGINASFNGATMERMDANHSSDCFAGVSYTGENCTYCLR